MCLCPCRGVCGGGGGVVSVISVNSATTGVFLPMNNVMVAFSVVFVLVVLYKCFSLIYKTHPQSTVSREVQKACIALHDRLS